MVKIYPVKIIRMQSKQYNHEQKNYKMTIFEYILMAQNNDLTDYMYDRTDI